MRQMNDTRYVLSTARGAPVYTTGHKYSLRKGEGKWRANAKEDPDDRQRIAARAASQLDQDVRWELFSGAPATLYDDTFPPAAACGPVGCSSCRKRDSIIRELFVALAQGWIDLKSNKFKRLERLALGVTK